MEKSREITREMVLAYRDANKPITLENAKKALEAMTEEELRVLFPETKSNVIGNSGLKFKTNNLETVTGLEINTVDRAVTVTAISEVRGGSAHSGNVLMLKTKEIGQFPVWRDRSPHIRRFGVVCGTAGFKATISLSNALEGSKSDFNVTNVAIDIDTLSARQYDLYKEIMSIKEEPVVK